MACVVSKSRSLAFHSRARTSTPAIMVQGAAGGAATAGSNISPVAVLDPQPASLEPSPLSPAVPARQVPHRPPHRPAGLPQQLLPVLLMRLGFPPGRVPRNAAARLQTGAHRRACATSPRNARSVHSLIRRYRAVCNRNGGLEQKYSRQPSSTILSSHSSSDAVLTIAGHPQDA